MELKGLVGLVSGRPDVLWTALERTARIVVPDGTYSLAPIFDTFALLDDGDVDGAARQLRDGLRRDLETGLLITLDVNAALFVNIAGRLGLEGPRERVRQTYAARPNGRLYESLMGEVLPTLCGVTVDEMTPQELAEFMVDALDVVLESDGGGSR